MPQIVQTQPNRQAEQIGAGIAAFAQNSMIAKRMQQERADALRQMKIEDEELARKRKFEDAKFEAFNEDRGIAAEERARALGEREAMQEWNAGQISALGGDAVSTSFGGAQAGGAIGGSVLSQDERRNLDRLVGKLSPAGGRLAIQDFEREKSAEIIMGSIPAWKKLIRNGVATGAIPEDVGATASQVLTREAVTQAPEMVLKTMGQMEDLVLKAHQQQAEDEAFALTWQIADQGIQEAVQQSMQRIKNMSAAERTEAMTEYRMLQKQWATLTPDQQDRRLNRLMSKLDGQDRKTPDEQRYNAVLDDIVKNGIDVWVEDLVTGDMKKGKPRRVSPDEARRIAAERTGWTPRDGLPTYEAPPRGAGMPSRQGVLGAGGMGSEPPRQIDFIERPASRGGVPRGTNGKKAPSFLSVKGLKPDEEAAKLADALRQGLSPDQAAAALGYDLETVPQTVREKALALLRSRQPAPAAQIQAVPNE